MAATLIAFAAALPMQARAQTPEPQPAQTTAAQPDADEVGVVASVQGNPTASRDNVAPPVEGAGPDLQGRSASDRRESGARHHLRRRDDVQSLRQRQHHRGRLHLRTRRQEQFGAVQDRSRDGGVRRTRGRQDRRHEDYDAELGLGYSRHQRRRRSARRPGATGEVAVKLYADQDGRVGPHRVVWRGRRSAARPADAGGVRTSRCGPASAGASPPWR